MGFETKMIVEKLGRNRWRLAEALVYRSELAGVIMVPAGFVTDFASVPRVPLIFSTFGNRGHGAAVIHDWLYQSQPLGATKEYADLVFKEALQAEGIRLWRAWCMWKAVHHRGHEAWRTGPARLKAERGR